MELPERAKLEEYMRKEHPNLDLPEERGAKDSIFNYRVDENGKCTNIIPNCKNSYVEMIFVMVNQICLIYKAN